jgi:hypothetical protein
LLGLRSTVHVGVGSRDDYAGFAFLVEYDSAMALGLCFFCCFSIAMALRLLLALSGVAAVPLCGIGGCVQRLVSMQPFQEFGVKRDER